MKKRLEPLALIMLFTVVLSLVAFVHPAHAQEGEVTLYAVDDTWIDSEHPDSKHGGEFSLKVSKIQYSPENTAETIVWLKFNLSDVPDGAIIDSAILRLYACIVTETHTVYAHSCNDSSWTELTLTYSNMPAYNLSSMSSANVTECCQWYSWYVVDAVREGLNGIHGGPDVISIVLLENQFHGYQEEASFWSEEMTDKPKLIVHWSEVIPEYPPLLALSLLVAATLLIVLCQKRKLRDMRARF